MGECERLWKKRGCLKSVSKPSEIFGRDTNSSESFLHILCRKLKDAINLGQELDGNQYLEDVY